MSNPFSLWLQSKIQPIGRKHLLEKLSDGLKELKSDEERQRKFREYLPDTDMDEIPDPTVDAFASGRRIPSVVTAKKIAFLIGSPYGEIEQVLVALQQSARPAVEVPMPPTQEIPQFVVARTSLWESVIAAVKLQSTRIVCIYGKQGLGKSEFVTQIGSYLSSGMTTEVSRRLFVVSLRDIDRPGMNMDSPQIFRSVFRRIAHQIGSTETEGGGDPVAEILDFLVTGGSPSILVIKDVNSTTGYAIVALINKLLRGSYEAAPLILLIASDEMIIDGIDRTGVTRLFHVDFLTVEESATLAADPAISRFDSAEQENLKNLLEQIEPRTPASMSLIRGLLQRKPLPHVTSCLSPLPITVADGEQRILERVFAALDPNTRSVLTGVSAFSWSVSAEIAGEILAASITLLDIEDALKAAYVMDRIKFLARTGWLNTVRNQVRIPGGSEDDGSLRYILGDHLRNWLRIPLIATELLRSILDQMGESVIRRIAASTNRDRFDQSWIRPLIPELHDIQQMIDSDQMWINEMLVSKRKLAVDERRRIERYLRLMGNLPLVWEAAGWYARGAEALEAACDLVDGLTTVDFRKDWSDQDAIEAKIGYLNHCARLMYRGNEFARGSELVSRSLEMAEKLRVPELRGQCLMMQSVFDTVKGHIHDARERLEQARVFLGSDDVDFAWTARLWEGRCEFSLGEYDSAAVTFRDSYALLASGTRPGFEVVNLLWLARTYLFRDITMRRDTAYLGTKPSVSLQHAKRCLIYAERLVANVPDESLRAHFDVLSGLYHRSRSTEDSPRAKMANDLFGTGILRFSRLADRYWLARYLAITAEQTLWLSAADEAGKLRAEYSEAVATDLLLRSVEYWALLSAGSRPSIPPYAAVESLTFVLNSLTENRVRAAGSARDLQLIRENYDYIGYIRGWADADQE